MPFCNAHYLVGGAASDWAYSDLVTSPAGGDASPCLGWRDMENAELLFGRSMEKGVWRACLSSYPV
jgi:hypothetical protein